MKIETMVFNVFGENTFIVWDEATLEALIIDPGCSLPEEEAELKGFIEGKNLKLKYIINTHCHIDHIFGNAYVKGNFNAEFLAPRGDLFLLDLMIEQASEFGVTLKPSPMPDSFITESLQIKLGENEIKFISTPGHTPDGYCVYVENEKICFTGDTLFNEGIGRTDLWGGNFSDLMASIKRKLFLLPDDVVIYPGHGETSTIGHEKNNNPFLG